MRHPDREACVGFDWDAGNALKNQLQHEVSQAEAEQVFLGGPLLMADDPEHSRSEQRYYCLGETAAGRTLSVVFTIRSKLIRVISARDMSRRERRVYDQATPEDH